MRIVPILKSGITARRGILLSLLLSLITVFGAVGWSEFALAAQAPSGTYYPERHNWEKRSPEDVGMDSVILDEAIQLAVASESTFPRDLAFDLSTRAAEPFDEIIGPTKTRAPLNGMVIRNGYIAAEWGNTTKVDMTFSVTKTFLSTVVGLAWQRGLIRDVDDLAKDYMPDDELFDSEHNAKITWNHLLRQTSDWRGTLWDKPDWADRPPQNVQRAELPTSR